MTRFTLVPVCCLVVASLWLSGCWPVKFEDTVVVQVAEPRPRPSANPSCPETRKIVRGCVDAAGWEHRPLFTARLTPDEVIEPDSVRGRLDAALGPYCVYEWHDEGQPDIGALERVVDPHEIYSDCLVSSSAAPTAAGVDVTALRELAQAFEDNVGLPNDKGMSPQKKAMMEGGWSPTVRVAVIDTGKPLVKHDASQTHGMAMLAIIDSINAEAPMPFEAELETLTAPYKSAVYAKIAEVINENESRSQPRRLIINLSLGWEQTPGLPFEEAVLVEARCADALVFAAAGNTHLGSCRSSDLLYPAAWHNQEFTCPTDSDVSGPLLWPVNAVDYDDQPLPTNRAAMGDEMLAAIGQFAVVESSGAPQYIDQKYMGPITGTSVSTAVTSALAASIWSADMDAAAVVERLRAGGSPVRACQAWNSDECPERVNSYLTWSNMMLRASAVTVQSPQPSTSSPLPAITPNYGYATPLSSGGESVGETGDVVLATAAGETFTPRCTADLAVVIPQPSDLPCKNCGIRPIYGNGAAGATDPNDELKLALDDGFFFDTYKNTWVGVELTVGTAGDRYSYLVRFTDEVPTVIEYAHNYPSGATYAYVTMYFTDGKVAGNQIPIYPPNSP